MQNLNILLVSGFRAVYPQESVAFNKALNLRKKCTGSYSADFTDRQTVLFRPVSVSTAPLTCAEVLLLLLTRKEGEARLSVSCMTDDGLLSAALRAVSLQKMESTKKLLLMPCPHRPCPAQRKPDPSHAGLSLCCLAAKG